jgi:hypothetical protein
MSGETWTEVSAVADGWTNLEDTNNGYVAANYVAVRYVMGSSGVTWSDSSTAATTWSDV